MKFILSIDQGTTGSTVTLINEKTLEFIGSKNTEFKQIFPRPSWVEHDLNDIWKSIETSALTLFKEHSVDINNIVSIGITNQRETTCAFNKNGEPLANAIVWQDRRTEEYCKSNKSYQEKHQLKTGLPLDPYFSGTKINWLLNNNNNVIQAHKDNNLLVGTIDTFLLYKLTGCESFYTEASNASRTLLMDLNTCNWDEDLLGIFEVPKDILPEIKDSFGLFGKTKNISFLPDGIPITGILGDQQAALFGQAGVQRGDMKCTYGTGAFLLLNTGDKITHSKNGLLTTVAYKANGKPVYALEGSSYIAGAAVQWLRDNLNFFPSSPEVESLANNISDLNSVENILFLPFFTGIGSPYWISDAKAAIVGITRDTNKSHISRACLEGICLAINDLINSMQTDLNEPIKSLKVDGGAVKNELILKLQASFSNLEIIRPKVIETTSLGAAFASAVGSQGKNINEIQETWKKDKSVSPEENNYYERKIELWKSTLSKLYL